MKKKVLHVVNISFVLPYFIGEQFSYFQKKGWHFFVACQPSAHFFQYANEKNFEALPVNISRSINPFADCLAIYKLYKLIRKEKIHYVVGHTPKGGLVSMLAAWLAAVPHRVYFRHGLMFETSRGMKRKILIGIERLTGRLATKVICVSPSVRTVSNEQHLSERSKNIILNKGTCNGIDLLKFNAELQSDQRRNDFRKQLMIRPNDQVIGYVGRLVNDKGIKELILAWKQLAVQRRHLKLLLVGPFEDRDALPDDVKVAINESPDIIFTGLVQDTIPYYAIMDIFVLPSFREGFPTVVLEASAMELPVLTTKATGCIDAIIDDVTGRYIETDPVSIFEKITFYLDNENIAKQHGKNGRAFVSANFSQELIWKEIETQVLS